MQMPHTAALRQPYAEFDHPDFELFPTLLLKIPTSNGSMRVCGAPSTGWVSGASQHNTITRLLIRTALKRAIPLHESLCAPSRFMQVHLNGFEPGDPAIFDPAEPSGASGPSGPLAAEADVLNVG
jgi:hypothetical protein